MSQMNTKPPEDEPIHLDDDDAGATETHAELKAFGGQKGFTKHGSQFKRALNLTGQGATRCRIFYSKISPPSLEYMESQINQWVDGDQIEIKQVSEVIGLMEGKTAIPNLIVTVWY